MKQTQSKRLDPPCQDLGSKIPHKNKDLERTENGSMIMNQRNLKIICQNEGLYEYPQMNNKIYLHFKVIEKIQNLDKYINLKTIYLQNNVITKIQNFQPLTSLQNLFLQNNMIKKIENLEKLKELRVINLSNNNIFKIEGLSQLPYLQNLNLANNYVTQFDDLEHLGQCTTELTSIDLSNNHIKPNQEMLNLIPQVKCLYLSGNPLVRQTKHYRRIIVGTLKNLLYLDQRGIDKQERMLSQAWVQGGQKAYKQARQKVLQHRQAARQERRQQIMKDIDVHRNRKISMFSRNIKEFQEQIEKLRGYMNEKGNEDMTYFYETKIAELYEKIRENQQFVKNINKRIGAAAKSISSGQSCNQSQKSICSEENKSKEEILLENNEVDLQKQFDQQYGDEDDLNQGKSQQIQEVETNMPTNEEQNFSKEQKDFFKTQCNDEQSSQLSFEKCQIVTKKVEETKQPMIPAVSSGLDQLD